MWNLKANAQLLRIPAKHLFTRHNNKPGRIGNIILYHDGRLEKKQILMDLGIVWGFFVCVLLYEAQITALIQRVSAIGEAVSGRSGNWKENLATISTDIFLGRGMVLLLCGRSADFLKTGTGKLL